MLRNKQTINHQPTLFADLVDASFAICEEKRPDNGEDSYLYMLSDTEGLAAAFDGCGGSGAKRYESYRNKTGAYMASRVAAGATKLWFEDRQSDPARGSTEKLKEMYKQYLERCKVLGNSAIKVKGSLSKEFPTTAAIINCRGAGSEIEADCIWAGDSRCYLLDETGLKQLSWDDLGGLDAMENLSADGVLTNVISLSKSFTLHRRTIRVRKPVILFSASDGCFGYFRTPMEFEAMLLETMMKADSFQGWQDGILKRLAEISGDDFTFCGFAFGFGSYENMKKTLARRTLAVFETYMKDIETKSRDELMQMWYGYKPEYSRYLSDAYPVVDV